MSGRALGDVLELEDVVKHYPGFGGQVVRAVDGVSLAVRAGEIVALHGPSGSGKSTMLMLAAGMTEPDAGAIRFEGRDLAAFSANEAADYQRQKIGFVYQSFHLMAGVPAIENAAIKLLADRVPLGKARKAAIPWLERVGLGERLNHTPDQLSGGERQRVAIARAIAKRPAIVLADEPTGNLDSRSGAEVVELLHGLAQEGATLVLITHDANIAATFPRRLYMRDGEIVGDEWS